MLWFIANDKNIYIISILPAGLYIVTNLHKMALHLKVIDMKREHQIRTQQSTELKKEFKLKSTNGRNIIYIMSC